MVILLYPSLVAQQNGYFQFHFCDSLPHQVFFIHRNMVLLHACALRLCTRAHLGEERADLAKLQTARAMHNGSGAIKYKRNQLRCERQPN